MASSGETLTTLPSYYRAHRKGKISKRGFLAQTPKTSEGNARSLGENTYAAKAAVRFILGHEGKTNDPTHFNHREEVIDHIYYLCVCMQQSASKLIDQSGPPAAMLRSVDATTQAFDWNGTIEKTAVKEWGSKWCANLDYMKRIGDFMVKVRDGSKSNGPTATAKKGDSQAPAGRPEPNPEDFKTMEKDCNELKKGIDEATTLFQENCHTKDYSGNSID